MPLSPTNPPFHVNGTALIYTGTGSGGGLEQLGISVDGVEIEEVSFTEFVHTDATGPYVPADIQEFGYLVMIRYELVAYDREVLWRVRRRSNEPDLGLMPSMGRLIGQYGHLKRLHIASPDEGAPHNYPFTFLSGARRCRLGTKRKSWLLEHTAIPNIGANALSFGAILWNRAS